MSYMTQKMSFSQLCISAVPFCLSVASVLLRLWALAAFALISVFPATMLLACFKGRESLGVFTISAVTVLPLNIFLVFYSVSSLFWSSSAVMKLMLGALLVAILISVEEIIMGVAARLIWRRQG